MENGVRQTDTREFTNVQLTICFTHSAAADRCCHIQTLPASKRRTTSSRKPASRLVGSAAVRHNRKTFYSVCIADID